MASIDASITSTGLISTGDATGILQLKSNGITALTVHANANVSIASGLSVSGSNVQPLILATQQTASGSTVDFTGIPSWVKKVTVMLNGVSASSIGDFYLRLGTGGVLATTGYFGVVSSISSGATATGTVTTGFWAGSAAATAALMYSVGYLTLMDSSTNTWMWSMQGSRDDTTDVAHATAGRVALSGTLDTISILPTAGNFDAGSINIMYE